MEHRLQTTSSSSSSLSGWTKYAEHKSETNWSSWSRTKPADQPGRSIESRHIPATYKTQYNYHGYYTSAKGGWWHFCPGAGRYFHGTNFYRIETGWRDSPISPRKMPQAQTCGGYDEFRYKDTNPRHLFPRLTRKAEPSIRAGKRSFTGMPAPVRRTFPAVSSPVPVRFPGWSSPMTVIPH